MGGHGGGGLLVAQGVQLFQQRHQRLHLMPRKRSFNLAVSLFNLMTRHVVQILALLGQQNLQFALIVDRFEAEDQIVAFHARQNAGQAWLQDASLQHQFDA